MKSSSKNSSIFRDGRMRGQGAIRTIVLSVAALCLSLPAHAIDLNRTFSQYIRQAWSADRGFTGGTVTALAQTRDGYLWIGTDKGLLRFDGSTFRAFPQATPTTFQIGPVQALMVDADANLWIVLEGTQLLRYYDGKFELGHDAAQFGITSVASRPDGTVLLSSLALGTLSYRSNKYLPLTSSDPSAVTQEEPAGMADDLSSRFSSATGVATHRFAEPNSAVISMAVTTDGKVWLGTRDKGLFYISGGKVLASGVKLPSPKVNCLLALNQGELWIGTDGGMVQWNGTESTRVPTSLGHAAILSLLRDRDSNIWVGTAAGLVRVNNNGISADQSEGPVTALFEDRDGNLWTGSSHGIQCIRDSAFVTYSVPGLHSESSGAIYADPYDRVWYAPIEGGLRWMEGEKAGSVSNDQLAQDVIYSIAGSKNELWLGRQQGGLTRLRLGPGSFAAKTYTQADGLAQNSVYTVHQNPDGTVWAGTLSGGLSKLKDGKFTTYTEAEGLGSNTINSIEDGPNGTMWFGTAGGLSELAISKWRTYTSHDGLPADDITSLLRDSAGTLWIGTSGGLAWLNSGHISLAPPGQEALREPILGLADDHSGSLWVATSNHVLRVARQGLLQGRLLDADFREYGPADGLHGTQGVKRDRSVVKDLHENVWFSLNSGLSVVRPNRANREASPPIAHVETLLVDGEPVALQGTVRIPAAQRRMVIHYSALSLADAGRTRFRYRMDGFDHGWSEPVTTREAIYTNLGPGTYRFRVVASNGYGAWNGTEAAIPLTIAPAFWQAWWFRLSVLLSLALLTWLIHRLRLLQISRQVEMRVEERASERTRIARELHDSLLQGFQGLLLYLQAAEHMLPARPEEAKHALEKVLDQGDDVLAEARRAVQDLRTSAAIPHDLAQALAAIGKELSPAGKAAQFRVLVEGKPHQLEPVLRDEVYRFAREALRNAFNHAQAQNIEVEITYGDPRFLLRVRDDGIGIDPKVISHGRRVGHWGLPGMRERAESLGAHMAVWSESGAGTEVELTIPASVAYGDSFKPEGFRFFRRKETPTS
jgi:ligand-binding sensor domain-containing protein/signal transduction histidine kinase